MNWHCVAEPLGINYCDGTPEWKQEAQAIKGIKDGEKTEEVRYYVGGRCKLSPETCGRCKTSQQLWDELPQEEKDRVSKPSYIETIIPIKQEDKTNKPKSAKAKKLEQEMAQRSMF